MNTFWRHLGLLLRKRYIDEEIAFEAFTSARMLGFLYPVEEAFLEYNGQTYDYSKSLKWLYDRWDAKRKGDLSA